MSEEVQEVKTISVEFTQEETQHLLNLVDAGVKALGLESVFMAGSVVAKVNSAIESIQ